MHLRSCFLQYQFLRIHPKSHQNFYDFQLKFFEFFFAQKPPRRPPNTWFGKIKFIREFINGPKKKVFISLYMGLYGSGWVEGFKLRCFEAYMTSCQKSLKIAKGPFLQ